MRQRGFGMVELLLGVTVAIVAGAGVFVLAKHADVRANVRQEQANAQEISEAVAGAYRAASDYSTLSTATAAGVLNRSLVGDSFNSAFHAPLTVRPATTTVANDSFELVYSGLTSKECTGLASAMKSKTQGIYIGSNASVQALDGTVSDESQIATQCAGLASTDTVALRFYNDKTTFAATTMDACMCAPQTDTQTLACASGQVGSVTQRRTATCTGGTPSCPSQVWSSWVTSSNTCGQVGAPVAPVTPVTPSAMCVPKVETRQNTCPSGQVGAVLQQRTTDCTTGTWGAWVNVGGSCATIPVTTACTPQVGPVLSDACPAGQGGQVLSQRSATCDSAGNLVWGAPQVVSSTCTASCVASGTCCKPRKEKKSVVEGCAQGSYGSSTVTQFLNYTCASPTATPTAWGGWTNDESTRVDNCTTCPADTMQVDTPQWVPRSNTTCPSGKTGENTWEAEQVRNKTTTYACNHAANTTSPTPTVTTGAWTDTGKTRNFASTCADNCVAPAPEWRAAPYKGSCPAGWTGTGSNWTTGERRTWSCPSTTGSPVASAWTWDGTSGVFVDNGDCTAPAPTGQPKGAALTTCWASDGTYWDGENAVCSFTMQWPWLTPAPYLATGYAVIATDSGIYNIVRIFTPWCASGSALFYHTDGNGNAYCE